jgi:hypothetical protein
MSTMKAEQVLGKVPINYPSDQEIQFLIRMRTYEHECGYTIGHEE